jgi:anti-sigma factor ChrR (cupin superfamily)
LPDDPPSAPRRHRLDTLPRCRREVARLYAEARQGKLDAQTASRLAHIVALAARMIEGAELEERIARLERQEDEHAKP